MIHKEELLKKVKQAIWEEERAFPIHERHILQSMPWYGFRPEEEERIRATLQRLGQETRQHAQILQELYESLTEADRDVY